MQVQAITPILNVSSLPASFAWFEAMGWKKLWDWPSCSEQKTFGAVGSGECEIFLCQDGQGGRGVQQGQPAGVWMSLWVENVDAVAAHCQQANISILRAPKNEPWGVREMHVAHPDGHLFRISQSTCE